MSENFSTSLFHYTRHGYDTIVKILNTGLKVNYCHEVNLAAPLNLGLDFEPSSDLIINHTGGFYPGATYLVNWLDIPMVSFCDLPTDRIQEHLSRYGQWCEVAGRHKAYGIGFSQKWAARNNLKQVSYEYLNNDISKKYGQVYKRTEKVLEQTIAAYGSNQRTEIYFPPKPIDPDSYWVEDNKGNSFPFEILYKKPINITRVIWTGGGVIKDKGGYRGESEWRYIPKDACILASYSVNAPSINRMLYDSVEGNLRKAKSEHKGYPNLSFKPEDIEVIVVDSSEDMETLKSDLQIIADKKGWTLEEVLALIEKVMTYTDIQRASA